MEKVDKQMEKRVWQRVQSRQEPPPVPRQDNLKAWVSVAQENTAVLRGLQLQLIGKQWEGLRRLEQDSARTVYTLRGLCALQGVTVRLNPVPTPKEPARRALEKCFHRSCRLREEMEKRCAEGEHAPVFRVLERRMAELAAALAEMLGRMDL